MENNLEDPIQINKEAENNFEKSLFNDEMVDKKFLGSQELLSIGDLITSETNREDNNNNDYIN